MAADAVVAFAGTPQFAVPALRALIEAGYDVSCVMTQPDRAAGRGRRLVESPVKKLALERNLVVHQPARLSRDTLPGDGWGPTPDALVVAAYGLLLPSNWLAWPRVAAVNVHASLLPRWRGASPVQHAILAGDAETGISLMRMTSGLDEGPVYAQRATPIGPEESSADLADRLAVIGAALLVETLPQILAASIEATPQDSRAATYAPKLVKQQARLDWRRGAVELARQVRAFDPWPVAVGELDDGRVLRIWRARPLSRAAGAAPGTIVAAKADGVEVATGEGRLRIERLQAPGAKIMTARDYLNAHRLDGARFVIDAG